jgi:hypothetical protein
MRSAANRILGTLASTLVISSLAVLAARPEAGETRRPPADTSPLARYFPAANLLVFAEFDGLDAHTDAWRQTAAHDILTKTTTGAMFEHIFEHLAARDMSGSPSAEALSTLLSHVVRRGFAFGIVRPPANPRPTVIAFIARGAGQSPIRSLCDRLLRETATGRRPVQTATHRGREISSLMSPAGQGAAWWFEKDDLVVALNSPEGIDSLLTTLEGQEPSAADHPLRNQLSQTSAGFSPVGWAFFDMAALPPLTPDLQQLGLAALKRVDYRWGFENRAIKTITRLEAPKPRGGLFALLDQPSFRRADLPPLPPGTRGFTTLSIDLVRTLESLLAITPGRAPVSPPETLEDVRLNIREKTGLDLATDILAPIGPTFTFYSASTTGTLPESAVEGFIRGALRAPRHTVVASVKNPETYAETIGRLMPELNKDLANLELARRNSMPFAREIFQTAPTEVMKFETKAIPEALPPPQPTEPAPLPKAAAPGPSSFGPRLALERIFIATQTPAVPMPGDPSIPQFQKLPDPRKGWTLSHPVQSLLLGLGLRPTVEVGNRYIALATAPATTARALAIESQPPGPPPHDPLAPALDGLPDSMTLLSVSDPRQGFLPDLLANLPSVLNLFIQPNLLERGLGPFGNAIGGFPFLRGVGQAGSAIAFDDPPDPDEIRKHLFPSRAVFIVSNDGYTLETVDAFPLVNPSALAPLAGAAFLTGFRSAQTAATRAQSTNNLKQIGLAIHNFHDAHGRLPADIRSEDGKPLLSWRVEILPFIEEMQTFQSVNQDEAWDSPANKHLLERTPRVFEIPNSPGSDPGMTFYRGFASPVSAFDPTSASGIRIHDFVDGTSNTLAVVEAREAVPWTKPGTDIPFDHDVPTDRAKDMISEVGGHFPGGFNALFMDGSVRFIKETVNKMVLRALITRNGGEVVSGDSF